MSGRAISRGLLALSLGAAMALAVGYTWLQTTGAKRWLADWIETLVSTSERQLTIGTLDGDIPFAPTVADISLSDSEGTWLTLDRASIRLDPLALLNRVALFEVVDVGRVVMRRQPSASSAETGDQPVERPAWPVTWPELPVDLEVERLKVTNVALGATVLGEAASFGVGGAMRLGDLGDGLLLDLALARTDGSSGSLSARMRYIPDTTRLVTELRLSEPAGGILSRLADRPALPALNVDLVGDGKLDDWEAELRIDGGDDLRMEAMATILEEGTGRRVVVDATGRLAAFADAKLRPLVDAETVLGASVLVVGDDHLRMDRFDVTGGFGAASLTGELDLRDETVDVMLRWVASESRHFALLTDAEASWSVLQLSATVTGPYHQPTLTLTINGDALAYRDIAIRSIAATVDASPAAPLTDAESQIGVVADVSIDGLYPGVELPSGWLEPSTRIAANGSITLSGTLDDPAATARLTVTDSVLAGYPMSEMRLAAVFEHLMRQPVGHVDLEGRVADLPARAAADIRFDGDGRRYFGQADGRRRPHR